MPLEVEQKFRVPSHDAVRAKLVVLGAVQVYEVVQTDAYLAHPSRDFRQTGEALRIRQSGEQTLVTYKGPKIDHQVKTRHELEFSLGDTGGETRELLTLLGFTHVADVRKQRECFELARNDFKLEIAFDTVDEVGLFVEVEAIANKETLDQAREAVVGLAAELGLTELEPRSYLRMLLEGRISD